MDRCCVALAVSASAWLVVGTAAAFVPAMVSVGELFAGAEIVASVRIIVADASCGAGHVYRADVLRGFKGVVPPAQLLFGYTTGYVAGGTYYVFLQAPAEGGAAVPVCKRDSAPVWQLVNGGAPTVEQRFECLREFGGCGLAVLLPGRQLALPEAMPRVRVACMPDRWDDTWVRDADFARLLETVATPAPPEESGQQGRP